ncbi:MAG TPA: ABC transporter permease subunit [Ignavibacteria bacterium]|nr:ABC transporter permease subunit [Ignavibacteria bacterium]
MIFPAIVKSTIREAFSRKILLSLFILFSFVILLIAALINLDAVQGIPKLLEAQPDFDYRSFIIKMELLMISQPSFLIVMILFIIMSSSFIPSLLQKGTVELTLSKPVSRTEIILGKFSGGVIIVFIALTYLISLIWAVISLKTGVWHFAFLYSILWYTLIFAVLYSLVILTGIITKSTIMSLIINVLLFFPFTAILSAKDNISLFASNKVLAFILNFIYHILPKPWDLRSLCSDAIDGSLNMSGGFFYVYQPVITSLIFMLVCLSLSVYYFSKKDY